MLKKIIISSTLFLAFQTATAHAGAYVGIEGGLGYDDSRFQLKHELYTRNDDGGPAVYGIGGALLGFDKVFCNGLYLGIEGSALYSGLHNHALPSFGERDRDNSLLPEEELTNDFRYLTAVHLGYRIYNALPYVSIGAGGGTFTLHIRNDSSTPSHGLLAHTTSSVSKNIFAFTPGLGVRVYITPRLLAGIEYDFLIGPTISKTFSEPVTGAWIHSDKIREHTFLLNFIYKFC